MTWNCACLFDFTAIFLLRNEGLCKGTYLQRIF